MGGKWDADKHVQHRSLASNANTSLSTCWSPTPARPVSFPAGSVLASRGFIGSLSKDDNVCLDMLQILNTDVKSGSHNVVTTYPALKFLRCDGDAALVRPCASRVPRFIQWWRTYGHGFT